MATLTDNEKTYIRNQLERADLVNYTKPQINAAVQAIEDAMTEQAIPAAAVGATIPQYISARIDTATDPLVLTAQQKKVLFALWAFIKFDRDK